jgi:hypothetical protein
MCLDEFLADPVCSFVGGDGEYFLEVGVSDFILLPIFGAVEVLLVELLLLFLLLLDPLQLLL